MDQEGYNGLDMYKKATYVWDNGKYVSVREYYGYKINLYLLPGFYVEVWYFVNENRIKKVELVSDNNILKLYPEIKERLITLN